MSEQRLYAVIDPKSPSGAKWREIVGTDHVPIKPKPGQLCSCGLPGVLIDARALRPTTLVRLCKWGASGTGKTEAEFFFEAIQGDGISICKNHVHVCEDVEEGRAFFARRDAEQGKQEPPPVGRREGAGGPR